MSKICVIVPTYNEAQNLPKLITQTERALQGLDFEVMIVDDSSPDGTAKIAEKLNRIYGNVKISVRAKKLGLGSALIAGLKAGLSNEDVECLVTLDADFSHDPNEIPRLLRAAKLADLVQGSRYIQNGTVVNWGFKRRLVSLVANFVCRFLLRTSIHDCTGNFRVYSRKCAETIVNSTASGGFEWVVEAMVVANKSGFKVKEIPITFIDRKQGKTKLKSSTVLKWGLFAIRNVFSPRALVSGQAGHVSFTSQKSSIASVTDTPPIASTTMYALSSTSPDLSDHAESMLFVKSTE
jgi:dolichol-phosphate mannosyltransferase